MVESLPDLSQEYRMADRVDAILMIFKWPFALLALLYLPAAAQALLAQSTAMAAKAHLFPVFLIGCGAYCAAWLMWFRAQIWGSAFSLFPAFDFVFPFPHTLRFPSSPRKIPSPISRNSGKIP